MEESQFDNSYKSTLLLLKSLPWEGRPQKFVQSAEHSFEGRINGKSVAFSWWQPGGKWGNSYFFLSLLVDGRAIFEDLPAGTEATPQEQQKNLKDFQDMVEYVRKLREGRMKTITISEDFQIPGTEILLEAGDTVQLQETDRGLLADLNEMLDKAAGVLHSKAVANILISVLEEEPLSVDDFMNDFRDALGEELEYH